MPNMIVIISWRYIFFTFFYGKPEGRKILTTTVTIQGIYWNIDKPKTKNANIFVKYQ